MSLSDVIRNIARTVTDREKAKEIPLLVIQSTLSAAGQALQLVDRVKNSIKGLGSKEDDPATANGQAGDDSRPAVERLLDRDDAKDVKDSEDGAPKAARREPVIFAPRPGTASANGSEPKPDPVIFSPAKPAPSSEAPAPATSATPADSGAPAAPEKAATDVPVAAAEAAAKPVAVDEPPTAASADTPSAGTASIDTASASAASAGAAPVTDEAEKGAEAEAAEGAAAKLAASESTAVKGSGTAAAERAPATAKAGGEAVAVQDTQAAAAQDAQAPAEGAAAQGGVAEPMPGYGELSVASLRARMRGKSVEQITELLAYEQATQGRAQVVKMYENRLAKLATAE
jgi:hypothetical protein